MKAFLLSLFLVFSLRATEPSQVVYHASKVQKIKTIKPHVSSHNEKWVYAARDAAIAVSFLIKPSCEMIRRGLGDNGTFHLIEKCEGALDLYKGVKGSLYLLPAHGFLSHQTDWLGELINPSHVDVLKEVEIEDAYEHLHLMEAQGLIEIYRYKT